MTTYIKKCPECGGINLILNKEKGEVICKDCGLVIEEKMIDFGHEWREFDHEQSSRRRRAGAPMTYSVDFSEPILIKKNNKLSIVKIGEFVDNLIEKNKKNIKKEGNLEYVNVEDKYEAVSFNGNYDVGFYPIKEVSRHTVEDIFEIEIETGKKIKVTGSHSVFSVVKNRVVPVKVSDLNVGCFVVGPKSIPVAQNFEDSFDLIYEFMKISNKHKQIYLRNIGDGRIFDVLKRDYGSLFRKELKNWKRHKTLPLWALGKIEKEFNIRDFDLTGAKIGIYSGISTLPINLDISDKLCRLLGYYVSEGTARQHSLVFSFGFHEKQYIQEVRNILFNLFGVKTQEFRKKTSAIQVVASSKLLSLLFSEVFKTGRNAKTKRVPDFIYFLGLEKRLNFLDCYVNGDGYKLVTSDARMVRPKVSISTSSVSQDLTNDLITLYSSFGIHANYQEAYIKGHIINKTGQFVPGSLATRSLITNPDSAYILGYLDQKPSKALGKGAIENLLPAPLEYKKEWKFRRRLRISRDDAIKIANKYGDFDLMKIATAEFLYLSIKSIKKVKPTTRYAYDISVPECENFVGGRGNIFLHNTKYDRGLGTSVGQKADVYQLGSKERNKFFRLRKWQYRISTAIERNLKLALAELKRVASFLKLPKSVEEESARIYTMAVQRGLVRGRSMESVVAGALYAACRRHEVPRTLDELSEASGIDKKEIGRTYRFITRELGIRILPSNPVDYIPRFASALKLSADTQSRAVDILEDAQKAELTSGRGPTGIAAASLYVAALTNNEKRTQREVADIAGVTEVTIRNRYKELLKELRLKDQIKKKNKREAM